jgi:phenylacetate-CoA ligase
MTVYGWVFKRLMLPAWENGLRARPTLALRDYLERTQYRPPDETEALQVADARRLVAHAIAHVPYYREKFAGIAANDIRSIGDLMRLPILDRDEARECADRRKSTSRPLPTIIKTTSGTSGKPLKFGYDPASEYWRQAIKLRGYAWAGYQPGMRSLHFWGGATRPLPPISKRAKIFADRLVRRERYIDCTRRGEKDLRDAVGVIRRWKPEVILAYTQAAADLARFIVDQGLRAWDDIPVILGAERLLPSDRAVLEQAFGRGIFETYGCREVMLIASECVAHTGLHLSSENLLVELVVRERGGSRAAMPGELGEVVLTDLHNFGMPFIRYANGDLAVAAEIADCACGRVLPRLASVEGRVTETLRDGAGNKVGGLVFNLIMVPLAERVQQFQAVQHKDGAVTLRLVPGKLPLDGGAQAALRDHVSRYLPGVSVRTEIVNEIPPTAAGKRQVVVVEV